jgi:hypothetical protein
VRRLDELPIRTTDRVVEFGCGPGGFSRCILKRLGLTGILVGSWPLFSERVLGVPISVAAQVSDIEVIILLRIVAANILILGFARRIDDEQSILPEQSDWRCHRPRGEQSRGRSRFSARPR